MAYKVKNKKVQDGQYILSYGRGKKKLQATMSKSDDGWTATTLSFDYAAGPFKTMKECKQVWGQWAEENYETGTAASKPEQEENDAPPAEAPPAGTVKTIEIGFQKGTLAKYGNDHPNPHCRGKWFVDHHGPYDTKQQAVAAFAKWAKFADGELDPDPENQPVEQDEEKPKDLKKKGPPSFKRKGPPSHKPKAGPPKHCRKPPSSLEFEFQHDPFDPRFKRKDTKELTPLGLLVNIEKWYRRHARRIDEIDETLQAEGPPNYNPLGVIVADVRATIARECPDLVKEDGNVQSPAEKAKSAVDEKRRHDHAEARRRERDLERDGEHDNAPF